MQNLADYLASEADGQVNDHELETSARRNGCTHSLL
jgi:hypothetical protein